MLALVLASGRAGQASPLRERIAALACDDPGARDAALAELERAPRGRLGLPDESLAAPAALVHGDVIDRLLEVLADARRRDPAAAPRIDALVASWDFCAITAQERIWDVWLDGDLVLRTQDPYPAAAAGRGFAAWGLIPRRLGGRPVIDRSGDPDDTCGAALPTLVPGGPLAALAPERGPDPACRPPPATSAGAGARPAGAHHGTGRRPASGDTGEYAEARRRRERARARAAAAAVGSITGGAGAGGAALPVPRGVGLALSGFARQALAGRLDAGAQLSWAIGRGLFARAGATWRLAADVGAGLPPPPRAAPGWSFGLGRDDWRPGTWSLQVNQWGPVAPGDGWKILETAAAELGYKVPLGARLGRRLGAKLALSTSLGLRAPPSASGGLTLKLPRAVFAGVSVSQPLAAGGRPGWTYVLGRSTWTPGSLAIIFANFGPNAVPHPNFVSHGGVTASWSKAW